MRVGDVALQESVHDVQVHQSELQMTEGFGTGADNAEPQPLPQGDGTLVRAHDGVELHGVKSSGPGLRQAVLAKPEADAATVESGPHHVPRIGNVRAQAALVRLERVTIPAASSAT